MEKRKDFSDQPSSESERKLPYVKPELLEFGAVESVTTVSDPLNWG